MKSIIKNVDDEKVENIEKILMIHQKNKRKAKILNLQIMQ